MFKKTDISNWIGGKEREAASGGWLDNWEPAAGEVYSRLPDSDRADVDAAVDAARRAFPAWSSTSPRDRAAVLRRIAQAIEARKEELARSESVDNGKPLKVSMGVDIPRSALNFEFFADAITQFASESYVTHASAFDGHHRAMNAINYTLRDPLGVVACISPWNLPLYLLTWKVAPALAAGNCVVAKPSEVTPMTAYLLGRICADAGLPPGVLNVVNGLGSRVGTALCGHPDVAAVSFTGSTRTGAEISRVAAPLFKKLSLEMGGKNPTIVFEDCDFEEAVTTTLRSAFSNQGQICLCGSRIFVQRTIYERFKGELISRVKNLRVGDPMDSTTDQGALVSKEHFEKVLSWLGIAKEEGGQFLTGGGPAGVGGRCGKGWFIEPSLIEGLDPSCRTNQEEIFGPVATLAPFDEEEEVLEWSNSTRYGLACNVWTRDLDRAHRLSARLRNGIVWVNTWMLRDLRTPFGGMKDSGVGREGGWDALRFFTEPKNVCVAVRDLATAPPPKGSGSGA